MAEIRLQDATHTQLDYAIAVALRLVRPAIVMGSNGPICTVENPRTRPGKAHAPYWFRPSQYWGHGGPLIAEFRIQLNHDARDVLRFAMERLLHQLNRGFTPILIIPDDFPKEKAQ